MTFVDEPARIDLWLYSLLEADTTLRAALGASAGESHVFDTDIPEAYDYAQFVVIQQMSAIPMVCQNNQRPGTDCVYAVKVVGKSKRFTDLQPALDRIEALLKGTDVTATVLGANWRFQVVERDGLSLGIKDVERTPGGTVYRHKGKRWPITIYAA